MVSQVSSKLSQLADLCKQYGVQRLEVFGSAATGEGFDPATSDADFIVEFRPGSDLGPWLQHYFRFREALSESLGLRIDLVMASAMKNEYFIREANRSRRMLYGT